MLTDVSGFSGIFPTSIITLKIILNDNNQITDISGLSSTFNSLNACTELELSFM